MFKCCDRPVQINYFGVRVNVQVPVNAAAFQIPQNNET